jgi:hypothetical protein
VISNIQEQVLKAVYYKLCNLKVYEIKIASGAVRGKTGKTSVIPRFSKLERVGSTVMVVLPSPGACAAQAAPLNIIVLIQKLLHPINSNAL